MLRSHQNAVPPGSRTGNWVSGSTDSRLAHQKAGKRLAQGLSAWVGVQDSGARAADRGQLRMISIFRSGRRGQPSTKSAVARDQPAGKPCSRPMSTAVRASPVTFSPSASAMAGSLIERWCLIPCSV